MGKGPTVVEKQANKQKNNPLQVEKSIVANSLCHFLLPNQKMIEIWNKDKQLYEKPAAFSKQPQYTDFGIDRMPPERELKWTSISICGWSMLG